MPRRAPAAPPDPLLTDLAGRDFLSPGEVARRPDVSIRTVGRLRDAGDLETVLVGCMPRITVRSYRAYILRQSRRSSIAVVRPKGSGHAVG